MTVQDLIPTRAPSASGFGKRAAASNLHPLWEVSTLHQTGEPQSEAPVHWAWSDVQSLIAEAIEETTTKNAERRVLLMGNPATAAMGSVPHVTPAMHGAIQILMPGEAARAHRHTPNALRLVLEDGGETFTTVDGKSCAMHRGDVILTPAQTWHGHHHEGSARTVWLDVLDSQLATYFDSGFFEPQRADSGVPQTAPDECFVEAGLTPVLPEAVARQYSPRFRFAWSSIEAALAVAPRGADGSAWVRFTNPLGGAMAMPPLDCYMVELGTQSTRAHRTTAGAICSVVRGSGRSTFGDHVVDWNERDVFTFPHWAWASHHAAEPGTVLFVVSDRGNLLNMNMLREEFR